MMEVNSELSNVSIIDSLLMAIDLETRAFMDSDEEANGTSKQNSTPTAEVTTTATTSTQNEEKNTNLQVSIDPSTNPPSQVILLKVDIEEVNQPTIVDPPLQHTSETPDVDLSTSSTLTDTTGSDTEDDEFNQTKDGTDEESSDDEAQEQGTIKKAEDTVNIHVPEPLMGITPKDPSQRVVSLEGPPQNTGWKSYKKPESVLSEEEASYKAKRERREMRRSMNYSNNNMHIKYNKSGMIRSLHGEVQKLIDERALLREQLGWVCPQQYKQYSTYDEAVNLEKNIGEPPKGITSHQYLLEERKTILHDIFFLNSLLEIAEENKEFRNQLAVLEKQVGTMFAEVKVLESTKDKLQKSKSKPIISESNYK